MDGDSDSEQLASPWLIAVWPGMGHVAMNAGFYLAAKLEMRVFAEFLPRELYDVDHVEVKDGIIRQVRVPRNRLFLWRDPEGKRDLVLFIGEAQPPTGKRALCRGLIDTARELGVERVFTFAALSAQMRPEEKSRVMAAATELSALDEVSQSDVEVLREGHIGGLNGVLLGAASEMRMPGVCLLGAIPHLFTQLPFPGASLAVLKVFRELSGIPIELSELENQANQVSQQLSNLLTKMEGGLRLVPPKTEEGATEEQAATEDESGDLEEPPLVSPKDNQTIESLFDQAKEDRSKAYELKQELDRLGVFAEYEDRFLDLFRKPEE
ncbi:MAG: PAC2 family protein [Planctomycetaceae bacterium]